MHYRNQPCAVVRFDERLNVARISIYRVPNANAPKGIVSAATQWFFAHNPECALIEAVIISTNEVSRRAFEKAGFIYDKGLFTLTRRGV